MKTKLFGLMCIAALTTAAAQPLETKQDTALPQLLNPIVTINNSVLLVQGSPTQFYNINYSDAAILTPNDTFSVTPWLRSSIFDPQDPLNLEETLWAEVPH